MGGGSYGTTGLPKPAPPQTQATPTIAIISSENDGQTSNNGTSSRSTSSSRFAPLVNHNRFDPRVTEGGFLADLGRGGYDVTNSPKPAPRPPRPKPLQPPRN